MYCSSTRHSRNECTKQANEYLCANCNGNHRANDPSCPIYKDAKTIEVIRAKTSKTYKDAKADLQKKSGPTPLKDAPPPPLPSPLNHSFRDAVVTPDAETAPKVDQNTAITKEYLAGILRSCLTDLITSLFPPNMRPQMDIGEAVSE